MKILEVGMHFDSAGGGADRYFGGLLSGLEAIGADFTAAAFGQPSSPSRRQSLGPTGMGLFERSKTLRSFAKRSATSHEVVATHFALYALPMLSALKSVPHVVHFHGPWAGESAAEGQNPWVVTAKGWVERRVYSSATRLITLSQAFREILIKHYEIAPERISVVPGGVDIQHFRPAASQAEARQKMGWPADRKIIFCVRRLVKRMGLENLVTAFARVSRDHPEALLVIGGRGPLANDLQAMSAQLGLGRQVLFAGFIADELLPSAYAAADFSIVPSVALEGFGLITLESLACGTPVIVTPSGGLPETVQGLDPSLVMRDSSVEALIAGLQDRLANPSSLPSPNRCRQYAEQTFAWPVVAKSVLEVYQQAAHGKR